MEATATTSFCFEGFINRNNRFSIDLSKSSLVEVIEEYRKFKSRTNTTYKLNGLISNIKIVEVMCGQVLMPIDVTDIFYVTFSEWLTQRGVNYGSQQNYLSTIRAALNWGKRHNCPLSPSYDLICELRYEPFTIALTPDEVSHIAHFDIDTLPYRPQKKRTLEKVRDHFVLSCQLGQRISDMVRVTKENYDRNLFKITQKKTNSRCVVNIDKFAMHPDQAYRIIKKYDGNAPWNGDTTNYDKYLHELCKCIGEEFNQEYKIEHKVKGEIKTIVKKKYELIASHTARRTFITYNSHRQLPIADMMRASGHHSLACFQKYIKFND